MSTLNICSVFDFQAKGDGVSDDTGAFNNAIASLQPYGGIVFVPYGHTYMIQGVGTNVVPDFPNGGVLLKSNTKLIMFGAQLQIIPNNSRTYTCLNLTDCDNVKIVGGLLIGDRYQHTNSSDYSTNLDQWGHGVSVVGSSNVYIENVKTKDFMGDGFCIGADSSGTSSSNVNMKYCYTDNVRRNGLSLISCYGGTITENTFYNTNGCSPECGIDMEPNPGKVVTDMTITKNRCLNNAQHGILLAQIQSGNGSASDCTISENNCHYNGGSGIYTNYANKNNIIDNKCLENGANGLAMLYSNKNIVRGNYVEKNKYHGMMVGNSNDNNIGGNYAYNNSQATDLGYDNFNFFTSLNNNIHDNTARYDLSTRTRYGMYLPADSTGNIVTNNDLYNGGYNYGLNNAAQSANFKGAGNKGNSGWGTGDWL